MRLLLLWPGGFVRVSVRGAAPERFVNLAARRGIPLWYLREGDRCLRGVMTAAHFLRIRPIARRARCRVHVEARVGLPFLWRRVVRRPGLVLGALAALAVLALAAGTVLFVEVGGASAGHREEILAAAHRAGLRPPLLRFALDPARVEEQVAAALPYVSWARLTFQGTLARLEVGEQEMPPPPPPPAGPADVVAAKAGELVYVLPLMGVARVQPGQRVEPGDVLISGAIPGRPVPASGEGIAGGVAGPARMVGARGVCLARVVYRAEAQVPCFEVVRRPTGRLWRGWVVVVGEREIVLRGRVPFELFETSQTRAALGGRNGKPLVEVIRTTYHEVEPVTFVRTPGEAALAAREEALRQVLSRVPAAAEREAIEAEVRPGDGGVTARVTVYAIEDIGVVRPR